MTQTRRIPIYRKQRAGHTRIRGNLGDDGVDVSGERRVAVDWDKIAERSQAYYDERYKDGPEVPHLKNKPRCNYCGRTADDFIRNIFKVKIPYCHDCAEAFRHVREYDAVFSKRPADTR